MPENPRVFHNHRCAKGDQPRGISEPVLLMATRAGRLERTPEAEGVLIEKRGDDLVFTLDDGEEIAFNAAELRMNLDAA